MPKLLLFIPNICGFTNFVQTTKIEHNQHGIAELLEVIISTNTQELKLAEADGDALFSFKEGLNTYDGIDAPYLYSEINSADLKLNHFAMPLFVNPTIPTDFPKTYHFKVSTYEVYKMITNYRYRHKWIKSIDEFQFNENECLPTVEMFWEMKTVWQKFLMLIGAKKQRSSAFSGSIDNLYNLMHQNTQQSVLE